MSKTISVTGELAGKVADFVAAETLAIEVVPSGDGTVRVVESEGRVQSDPSALQAGGWITCEGARAMASKLGIPVSAMGKLVDVLDIKIRSCELGCFE